MAETGWRLLLSCEHGGNLVPPPWRGLFAGAEAVLESHRGYDPGIAPLARWLATELGVPLLLAETTRLLVELNRSAGHPGLFSEFCRPLSPAQRRQLLESYYHPYRRQLTERIAAILAAGGRVCHLSLHSFTPELHGELRNADIGLLYDPRRRREQEFCRCWRERLLAADAGWRVRRNYPYRGTMDSLVVALRRQFPQGRYLGLELELNQRWLEPGEERLAPLRELIRDSLRQTLAQAGGFD